MYFWIFFVFLLTFSKELSAESSRNENIFSLYTVIPFDEELCSEKECMINNHWTSEAKCEYIKCNSDSCEGGGYLSWSEYVNCQYNIATKVVIIVFAIVYLLILFLIMSVVADDFFSPAISGIVSHLRMSESIAGVTFLAFGNGAPDVFGSISSVLTSPNPKADLALGDLFGGAIFVTTIVLAAIILTTSFRIAIVPTIRDILFFIISLAFILFCFLKFDHIEVWMPATFLGIYALYVVSVVVLHILRKRRKLAKQRKLESSLETSRPSSASSTVPIVENLNRKQKSTRISSILESVPICSRFMKKTDIKNMEIEKQKPSYYDNIAFTKESNSNLEHFDHKPDYDDFKYLNRKENDIIEVIEEDELDYDDEGEEAEFVYSHGTVYKSHDQASLAATETEYVQITSWKSWSWVRDLLNHLKPYPAKNVFREMNIFSKTIAVIKIIPMFLFKLTIPSNESTWCKPLFILHCFTSVQFALFAIQISNTKPFNGSPGLWLYGFGFSIILSILVLIFTPLTKEQKYYKEVFSYISFLMSICWIYTTSNEIVGVLTMIGVVTGLSQELLGLTIMAWSNCIGDVVADIAVVKQGFPKMAMAAAIGGPLFNLLIGFGLPFTIAAAQGKQMELKINSVYRLLMLFLGISLITTLIAIFVQRFRVRWPHAAVLIVIFVVFIVFICLSEFHVLEWN